MLDDLTRLTQSADFLRSGSLRVQEVRWQPRVSPDLVLRLELVLELPPDYYDPPQEWEVRCHGPLGGNLNHFVQDSLQPYGQLRVLDRHPVLWGYDNGSTVRLEGHCPDPEALLGSLYAAHGRACGHWVPFHEVWGDLPAWLARGEPVSVEVPSGLLGAYGPACAAHGLRYRVVEELRSRYAPGPPHPDVSAGRVLLFGNAQVADDEENVGQPFQVAAAFTETRFR